jgi:pimeloyl-ACP methyl ester carboxylesterase
MTAPVYTPRRAARSQFVTLRGLRYHLLSWGDPSLATPERPPLVLLHGWMDVAASFQFMVDALADERYVVAADWRGFGLSESSGSDSYWFPDYLGDLDTLLDLIAPEGVVDLLGHSMGGNVAMLYAGLKPQRVRRLVNLEGFGLPRAQAEEAPQRLLQWLQTLRTPPRLRPYASLAAVAERLLANDPRLAPERAAWLRAARRPGAQARQPGALPGRRGARLLAPHHRAAAVGRGRAHRHRPLVGLALFARRVPRAPGRRAPPRAPAPGRGRAHAAPRPARGLGRAAAALSA